MDAATLDEGTRSTDGFAAHARVSAVRQGYIQDEFVSHFVPRARNLPTHAPLINIGTYLRTTSIDRLVEDFLKAGAEGGVPVKKQIVSLGAGSDTRFWRLSVSLDSSGFRCYSDIHLKSGPLKGHISSYVELDFAEITSKKAMAIRKSKALSTLLGDGVKVGKQHLKVGRMASYPCNSQRWNGVDFLNLSSSTHRLATTFRDRSRPSGEVGLANPLTRRANTLSRRVCVRVHVSRELCCHNELVHGNIRRASRPGLPIVSTHHKPACIRHYIRDVLLRGFLWTRYER